MRFAGLALEDPVPDAKTIRLFREQLTRTGTLTRLFERFDTILRERGSRRCPLFKAARIALPPNIRDLDGDNSAA